MNTVIGKPPLKGIGIYYNIWWEKRHNLIFLPNSQFSQLQPLANSPPLPEWSVERMLSHLKKIKAGIWCQVQRALSLGKCPGPRAPGVLGSQGLDVKSDDMTFHKVPESTAFFLQMLLKAFLQLTWNPGRKCFEGSRPRLSEVSQKRAFFFFLTKKPSKDKLPCSSTCQQPGSTGSLNAGPSCQFHDQALPREAGSF